MKHEAEIYFSSHRVLATNHKTGENTKTIGWRTPCSCGLTIETKQNSIKAHKAKVAKHTMEVNNQMLDNLVFVDTLIALRKFLNRKKKGTKC